jgi:hypothetical protein
MWTIISLVMGEIALGKGAMSGGLLEVTDVMTADRLSLYAVVLALSPVLLVCAFLCLLSCEPTNLNGHVALDHLNVRQPYYCKCVTDSHCERSGVKFAWDLPLAWYTQLGFPNQTA